MIKCKIKSKRYKQTHTHKVDWDLQVSGSSEREKDQETSSSSQEPYLPTDLCRASARNRTVEARPENRQKPTKSFCSADRGEAPIGENGGLFLGDVGATPWPIRVTLSLVLIGFWSGRGF